MLGYVNNYSYCASYNSFERKIDMLTEEAKRAKNLELDLEKVQATLRALETVSNRMISTFTAQTGTSPRCFSISFSVIRKIKDWLP
jgi:hypothetical protein